ncbi:hypothetical protein LEP1GSC081_4267 [Leptospira kirschneri str. H1]|uniref:Uncharacterized protein n=1 Tax=Leptospira kirschneri str. H1 TaxID=1049966 RepID=A0A0E2BEB1_9LEPT|nr:hypothetical protein LEP1GSC081_4267 [Leptospira kirschneri str. H1]
MNVPKGNNSVLTVFYHGNYLFHFNMPYPTNIEQPTYS